MAPVADAAERRLTEAGEPLPRWLASWDDFSGTAWPDLLVGNGVSRLVDPRFDYPSLRETLLDRPYYSSLGAVFDGLETDDFEEVLGVLHAANKVNKALGVEDESKVTDSYNLTREALVDAVIGVHPRYATVSEGSLSTLTDSCGRERASSLPITTYFSIGR